ncbi:hypothetical protein Aut01nite_69210 [Actinoplanes utahensis]|nr:hypothetical protein Aut01nite_69210 [Actinoplanes utahensis]
MAGRADSRVCSQAGVRTVSKASPAAPRTAAVSLIAFLDRRHKALLSTQSASS